MTFSRRAMVITLLVLTLVGIALVYAAGSVLSAPANRAVPPAPADLQAQTVEFAQVHGWLVSTGAPGPCVVLMHGVGADRSSMIERARWLKQLGYSSLLFDFQAHGETPGEKITFGYREAANAHAAVAFLRQSGLCTKVAGIGQSMGGAASLLGPEPLPVDALVLESVYPTIEQAVRDRMQRVLGFGGIYLAPLLYEQIPLRIGVPLAALHPADAVRDLHCPVFVLGGTADLSTHADETQHLFANAPGPKQLWLVPGAGHVDLFRFAGEEYRQRVGSFLDATLRAH